MSGIDKFRKSAGSPVRKEAMVQKDKLPEPEKKKECIVPGDPACIDAGLQNVEEEKKEIKKAYAAVTAAVELDMARRYQRIKNVRVR